MQDWYQMPAFVLTALLLPAFGQLYWRNRNIRNLLWFLAFLLVVLRAILVYPEGWDLLAAIHPWKAAAGRACGLLSVGLFLASLSPNGFRIGKIRVLYAIPFILPLFVYALLAHGVYQGRVPEGPMYWIFPFLGLVAIAAGMPWAMQKGNLPPWIAGPACLLFGGTAILSYFRDGLYGPLILAEAGANLVMAMLVGFTYRRASSGVVISVLGFLVRSSPALLLISWSHQPAFHLILMRSILMSKVAVALGLILLALENETEVNANAASRERRVRRELEAYTRLVLSRRRVEDFDRQSDEICQTIVRQSRFQQAALILLHRRGAYRLTGAAGFDAAIVHALESVVGRISASSFPEPSMGPHPVANSEAIHLDLRPWMIPGDDLEQLRFTSVLAIPLFGRSAIEGALLLNGLRSGGPLRADDLIPLEMLATRLQAVRGQTRMLEKLIDAEKFAGIGQLAANVSQQLNNPLTVILGYASLLEEMPRLDPQGRRGVEAILASARSMRATLESLQRVAHSPGGQLAASSLTELLGDMERLHRSEFLQRSIELQVSIPPDLPHVRCQAQQLRQAILHCLQFAMDAVDRQERTGERSVRLEAASDGNQVQIVIAHTGCPFESPERVFDPFLPTQAGEGETAGLGLSLCATILRDNDGKASARNLEPRGAAIVLDLQAA